MADISRRSFITTTAAAIGAACVKPAEALAARQKDNISKWGWPVGIHNYYLRSFQLEAALAKLQDLGLSCIEITGAYYPPTQDKSKIEEMDQTLAEYGVCINAYGGGLGRDHKANTDLFWFARMAGIRHIVAEPEPEAFDSIERLVRQFNIRVCIHNRAGARYQKPEDCIKAAEGRDRRIGFCIDTGQYMLADVDPIDAIRRLGDRLYGVHVKDQARMGAGAPSAVVGEGKLDLPVFYSALRAVKFPSDGFMTLEYEVQPDKPDDDVRRCLANMEKALGAQTEH